MALLLRFVILRVLLEAANELVTLSTTVAEDGQPDLEVTLDRAKIATVGKQAIGDFLLALQVHKSLGDLAGGSALFERYSHVDAEHARLRRRPPSRAHSTLSTSPRTHRRLCLSKLKSS